MASDQGGEDAEEEAEEENAPVVKLDMKDAIKNAFSSLVKGNLETGKANRKNDIQFTIMDQFALISHNLFDCPDKLGEGVNTTARDIDQQYLNHPNPYIYTKP